MARNVWWQKSQQTAVSVEECLRSCQERRLYNVIILLLNLFVFFYFFLVCVSVLFLSTALESRLDTPFARNQILFENVHQNISIPGLLIFDQKWKMNLIITPATQDCYINECDITIRTCLHSYNNSSTIRQ